jgi:hypothetical protein
MEHQASQGEKMKPGNPLKDQRKRFHRDEEHQTSKNPFKDDAKVDIKPYDDQMNPENLSN